MCLLSKPHSAAKRDRRKIQDIYGRKNPVLVQTPKNIVEQTFDCLVCILTALVAWRECDTDLHLMRVLFVAVQTTITYHASNIRFNDCQLEPFSCNTWLRPDLLLNQASRIVRAKRIPMLVTRNFG